MGTRCLSRGSAGQGGSLKDLEYEFATGTLWYRQHKVASAAAEKPPSGEAVGAGWADVKLLAKVMRKGSAEVEAVWGARKAELQ